jgi:hypothetical protein
MFEFKRTKPKVSSDGDIGRPPRFFPDGIAALRYACKFLECPLHEGTFLPAVVLDPRELFGTRDGQDRQGWQSARFPLCRIERRRIFVAATTAGPRGPRLEPGQLVAWKAVRHVPDIANSVSDKRFGWVGVIVGTLKAEHRDGCWVGTEIFRPSPPRAA